MSPQTSEKRVEEADRRVDAPASGRTILAVVAFAVFAVALEWFVTVTARPAEYSAPLEVRAFTSPLSSSDWAKPDVRGNAQLRFEPDGAHIEGTGEVWLRALPRRTTSRDTVTLRFKLTRETPFDVLLGFEAPGSDPPRRLLAVYRVGPETSCGLEGAIEGTRDTGGASMRFRCNPRQSPEHDLRIDVYGRQRAVVGNLDGAPLPAWTAYWWIRTEVRPIIGVRAREPNAELGVVLREYAYCGESNSYPDLTIDERFADSHVDPKNWILFVADPLEATVDVHPEPGAGLRVTARSKTLPHLIAAARVVSRIFPLRSFEADVEMDVRAIDKSATFVRVAGEVYSANKRFDLGITDDGGRPVGYCAGDWDGTSVFERHPDLWHGESTQLGKALRFGLKYDARKGDMVGLIDGTPICTHHLDLSPFSDVQLEFGGNLHEPGAFFAADIRHVRAR